MIILFCLDDVIRICLVDMLASIYQRFDGEITGNVTFCVLSLHDENVTDNFYISHIVKIYVTVPWIMVKMYHSKNSIKGNCFPMELSWYCALYIPHKAETRRSENDDTPQPLDQWTNSPFMGQQVGNWSICHALWPKRKPIVHPTLYPTHISFIPSQSTFPFLNYGYQKFDLENIRSRSCVRSKF